MHLPLHDWFLQISWEEGVFVFFFCFFCLLFFFGGDNIFHNGYCYQVFQSVKVPLREVWFKALKTVFISLCTNVTKRALGENLLQIPKALV